MRDSVDIVALGSENPVKRAGLIAALQRFFPADALPKVVGVAGAHATQVPAQPTSLDEMFIGAHERARKARQWTGADLGVGLESGVFEVRCPIAGGFSPRHVDACACVVRDRDGRVGIGLSAGFELPDELLGAMQGAALEMTDAVRKLGWGEDVGRKEGVVGLLTRGRMNRVDQVEQAALLAFAKLTWVGG